MRNFRSSWILSVSSLSLLLGGCGGGGGGSGTASTPAAVVVTPAPAPAPSPTPTPTPAAVDPSSAAPTGSWAARAAALFTSQPDVPNCRPGVLADSVRADVLARLNAIRALHRLPAVTYSSADDEQATQAALMMAANGQLTHTPPADWKCYTDTGSTGAGTSNLYGGLI